VSTIRAALHTVIDLGAAVVLAVGVAVGVWYYVGDGEKLKGELAVRLGAESVGVPALGDRADRWAFGESRRFVAAENPATDDRLTEWLAAQPGVGNVRVARESDPTLLPHFHYDTTLWVNYDRPGHFGPVAIDWPARGYRPPADDFFTRGGRGPTGYAPMRPEHSRGVLWLIGLACAHGALLVVVLARVAAGLARGRRTLPADTMPTPRAVALVAGAAVVLGALVALNEHAVVPLFPHATARGWVWFGALDWINTDAVRTRIYFALLAGPLAVQLFVRYLLAARWAGAGRALVAVPLTAVTFAALWLDLSLVPLGLAVGAVLGWLAARGVPAVGLIALHALVNGSVYVFLLGPNTPPPLAHDPRLIGTWQSMRPPSEPSARIEFKTDGTIASRLEVPPGPLNGRDRSDVGHLSTHYLALDREYLMVRRWGKVRVQFEGDELVITDAEGLTAGRATRYRRVP
jgi:hypothetical protein